MALNFVQIRCTFFMRFHQIFPQEAIALYYCQIGHNTMTNNRFINIDELTTLSHAFDHVQQLQVNCMHSQIKLMEVLNAVTHSNFKYLVKNGHSKKMIVSNKAEISQKYHKSLIRWGWHCNMTQVIWSICRMNKKIIFNLTTVITC